MVPEHLNESAMARRLAEDVREFRLLKSRFSLARTEEGASFFEQASNRVAIRISKQRIHRPTPTDEQVDSAIPCAPAASGGVSSFYAVISARRLELE
jgi:hypothetical protein